jgi:nicotinamidase-related amidase
MASQRKAPNPVEQGNLALLVVDVQQGLFRKSTPIFHAETLLENIDALVERAHQAGAPVIYIQHSDPKFLVKGSANWQLHADLQPQNKDWIVHKQHGNAFEQTKLDEILKSQQVTRLVICGLVTQGCVRATCLGALEMGYPVILAQDAHSTFSKDAGKLIDEWNQKLGEKGAVLQTTMEIAFGN